MVVLTMCIEELKNTYVTDGQVDHVYWRTKKHIRHWWPGRPCVSKNKETHTSLMVRLTMWIEELGNTYVTDGQVDQELKNTYVTDGQVDHVY